MIKQLFTDAWVKVKPFLSDRIGFLKANAGNVLFWLTMGVGIGFALGLIFG